MTTPLSPDAHQHDTPPSDNCRTARQLHTLTLHAATVTPATPLEPPHSAQTFIIAGASLSLVDASGSFIASHSHRQTDCE
jgi:hypothetical protein